MIADLREAARLHEHERSRLAGAIALALAAVLAATALMTTAGYLITRCAQITDILEVTAVITAIRAIALVRAIARYGERVVSHDLALRVLARLRSSFYAVLAPLGATALEGHGSGELLSRFVADVDTLQDLYLRALAPPVVAVLAIVATALASWVMLPVAGLVLAVCLIFTAIAVPALSAALAASAGRRQAQARAALTSELVESLDGAVELAVAGRAEDRAGLIERLGRRLTALARRDAVAGAAATTAASFLTGLTVVAILVVAIPGVRHGELGGVYLTAIVMLTMGAFEALAPLPVAARSLRRCADAASRLAELRELPPAAPEPREPRPMPAGSELRLEDVELVYSDGTNPLRGLSGSFPPHCRVAIQGSSGAGKTTLAQLLVRFLDPTRGRVLLDGVDVRELPLHELRARVALAEQDAHVFTTTIRENLLLANHDAGEQRLWAVLRAVRLEEWVRSLPDGLDTLVGEDGDLLSGGQRQRLTIARALLTDAPVVILDEPTAQVDASTSTQLIRSVIEVIGDRSLIMISHRSEGLGEFDTVLTLRDGSFASA